MSARIAECRGIGEAPAKDCVETAEPVAGIERCTVKTDVCSLATGDAGVKAQETGKEEVIEDCCCCDC